VPSSPELAHLSHKYAAAADRADGPGLAELFTAAGALEVRSPPPSTDVVVHRGRTDISERINALRRYERTRHIVGEQHFEVEGDTVRGTTDCVAHHIGGEAGEGMDRVVHIRYDDRYAREDGEWRFAERRVVMLSEAVVPMGGSAFPPGR
jgi:hypothetical protein